MIFGGGHAATIALRAAGKGLVKPSGIAAVAPTWAGPLPIVFGRGSEMESRYMHATQLASPFLLILFKFVLSICCSITSFIDCFPEFFFFDGT